MLLELLRHLVVEQEKETNVSEARHTKGPWKLQPAHSASGERTGWLLESSGRYIGDIHMHVGEDADDAQDEANARLAQAAPAYREAWGMVPEKYRKAALEVLPPWVREAVKATGGDPGDEDAEAVRVRVAAPEMLEALKETTGIACYRLCDWGISTADGLPECMRHQDDCIRHRALIAKAEGRQP